MINECRLCMLCKVQPGIETGGRNGDGKKMVSCSKNHWHSKKLTLGRIIGRRLIVDWVDDVFQVIYSDERHLKFKRVEDCPDFMPDEDHEGNPILKWIEAQPFKL